MIADRRDIPRIPRQYKVNASGRGLSIVRRLRRAGGRRPARIFSLPAFAADGRARSALP
jgi:hypothetical protein